MFKKFVFLISGPFRARRLQKLRTLRDQTLYAEVTSLSIIEDTGTLRIKRFTRSNGIKEGSFTIEVLTPDIFGCAYAFDTKVRPDAMVQSAVFVALRARFRGTPRIIYREEFL